MIPYAICKRKRNNVEIAGILCTFFVYLVRAQNCTIGIVAGRTREYEGMMSVCSCVKRQRKTQTFFSVCSKCKISGTTSYCFSADNSEKHPLQISLPLKGVTLRVVLSRVFTHFLPATDRNTKDG